MDIPRKSAKRRRCIRRSLYALTGLSAIALIAVGVSRLKPAVPSVDRRAVVVGTVERGLMLRKVRGVGSLVSTEVLWVPAEVKGRVRRVLVEPGTVVQPDTVILELTDPSLELELLDAQSKLDSAIAALSAMRVSLEDQYLTKVASLAQMEASYKEAKLRTEVEQKQYDKKLISELQLALSKTRVADLGKQLEIDRRRFQMFREQTMPAQLAEQKASLRQAISFYELKKSQTEAQREGILAIPSKRFQSSHAYFQIVMLAYNLWRWLKQVAGHQQIRRIEQKKAVVPDRLPVVDQTVRLTRLKMLFVAAKISHHSNREKVYYSIHESRASGIIDFLDYLDRRRAEKIPWPPPSCGTVYRATG